MDRMDGAPPHPLADVQTSSFQSRVPNFPSKVAFIFGASNIMSSVNPMKLDAKKINTTFKRGQNWNIQLKGRGLIMPAVGWSASTRPRSTSSEKLPSLDHSGLTPSKSKRSFKSMIYVGGGHLLRQKGAFYV